MGFVVATSANVAVTCSPRLVRETYTVSVDSPVYVNVQHIYSARVPSRSAILMVHGCWHTSFFYHLEDDSKYSLMEFLANRRFDTYALDLRGSGASYKGDYAWFAGITLQDYVEDVKTAVEGIQEQGYEKIFLVGHSMGGIVTVLYTAAYPETLHGLILIGTLYQDFGMPEDQLAQLRYAAETYPFVPCLPEYVQPMFFAEGQVTDKVLEKTTAIVTQEVISSTAGLQMLDRIHAEKVAELPEDLPVLLLKGELDALASNEDAENFLNALNSEDKRLRIIKGHGHDLLLEKKPKKVYKVIFQWLWCRTH